MRDITHHIIATLYSSVMWISQPSIIPRRHGRDVACTHDILSDLIETVVTVERLDGAVIGGVEGAA